ncbi:MAG: helicase C-terminal domain-containing protein, partial [Chloroflexota bacterium]|nr:helicase C-terminal domain-containing protein [Chloroflexota bacterium]
FKPVFVSPYAKSRLWRHGERFLAMSATIISARQFARDLGLKPEDVAFIDMPSSFPPERWPIHYRPVADMTHRNQAVAWPAMVEGIDEVLAAHPDEKGLVHTHSYALARYICQHSRFEYRLLQHEPNSRVSALESFKVSNEPQVLVSPSMDRGVDLPGDLCRFLVVAKVPFPYLGDPQIAARLYSSRDGDMWYAVQTVRALVQSTGRGMRSPDDYCTNYILDAQFGRLWGEQEELFPVWWRQALLARRGHEG